VVEVVSGLDGAALWTFAAGEDLSRLRCAALHPPEEAGHAALGATQTAALHPTDVDGALLKARSPSCGVGDARYYGKRPSAWPNPFTEGDGFFADALRSELLKPGPRCHAPFPMTSEKLLSRVDGCAHDRETCLVPFLLSALDRFEERRAHARV